MIVTVIICIFGVLMFAAVGILMNSELCADMQIKERIIFTCFAVLFALLSATGGIFSYISYYNKYIKPKKHPEMRFEKTDDRRKQEMRRRLPGRDIYDALNLYRKRYLQNRIILLAFGMLLVLLIVLTKFGEYGIDLRIALLVGIGIILLSCILVGKKDVSFMTDRELRDVIAKSGVDPLRLDADFMMATNHKLFDGIAVLGMDFLVIYARKYANVIKLKEIQWVLPFTEVEKKNGIETEKYRCRIRFGTKQEVTFTWKDKTESDLFADELGIRGLTDRIRKEAAE